MEQITDIFENAEVFKGWIESLSIEKVADKYDAHYNTICNSIWSLLGKNEIDNDWADSFERNISDVFFKNLELLEVGLNQWYASQTDETIINLKADSGFENEIFESINRRGELLPPPEIQKTWFLFTYWGSMYSGEHHPKYGKFITVFQDEKTKAFVVDHLLKVVKELI